MDAELAEISGDATTSTEVNDSEKEVQRRVPDFSRTPPCSRSKKVHSSFKSPLQTPVAQRTKLNPEEEVEELRKKQEELDKEISLHIAEGYRVEELERHIDLLHEYNEVKDIGQTLLGRIAVLRGTTTRDLYSQFGLGLDD
ncbi:DNA repair protein SWI5 homolog [Lampris incognitus]|uniref:DNA repair protein SWI5 homolog n=1 Tax=Lampris incognitus TaxID=2546036 RepID=UPI0024B63141|nr:DNA repair protein SWI5 homolog [Lampris incognitus]